MTLSVKAVTIIAILALQVSGPVHGQGTVQSGHTAVEKPAILSESEASKVYAEIQERMAESYALARLPIIKEYQSWTRYNSAPYLSATHGQRFVNNYANDRANGYGNLAKGEKYRTGTVFAKDSVTVTEKNEIFPGAMFVMEKLPIGTNPETADWRYVMVLPDGTLYGDTTGDDPEQVEYCHACHAAKAGQDFVFFVPEKFQRKD